MEIPMFQLGFNLMAFIASGVVVAATTPVVVKCRAPLYFLVGLEPQPAAVTWNDVGFAVRVTLVGLFVVVALLFWRRKGRVASPTDMALYAGGATALITMFEFTWNYRFVEQLLGSYDLMRMFLVFGAMLFLHGVIGGITYFACCATRVRQT